MILKTYKAIFAGIDKIQIRAKSINLMSVTFPQKINLFGLNLLETSHYFLALSCVNFFSLS